MSQSPYQPPGQSPYQPPDPSQMAWMAGPGAYDPYGQLLRPARRSGVMMIVLGSLATVCGACMLAVLVNPDPRLTAAMPALSDQTLRKAMGVVSVLMVAGAVAMIVCGVLVRKGGIGAIVTAIVLVSLAALYLLTSLVGSIIQGGQQSSEVAGSVLAMVLLALLAVLLVWLSQAARAARHIRAAQDQYRAQYYQYQLQQQAYQGGMTPPPPPPPPAAPTPPPASPGSGGPGLA